MVLKKLSSLLFFLSLLMAYACGKGGLSLERGTQQALKPGAPSEQKQEEVGDALAPSYNFMTSEIKLAQTLCDELRFYQDQLAADEQQVRAGQFFLKNRECGQTHDVSQGASANLMKKNGQWLWQLATPYDGMFFSESVSDNKGYWGALCKWVRGQNGNLDRTVSLGVNKAYRFYLKTYPTHEREMMVVDADKFEGQFYALKKETFIFLPLSGAPLPPSRLAGAGAYPLGEVIVHQQQTLCQVGQKKMSRTYEQRLMSLSF